MELWSGSDTGVAKGVMMVDKKEKRRREVVVSSDHYSFDGRKLKELREKNGYSMRDLVYLFDTKIGYLSKSGGKVTAASIGSWEHNGVTPNAESLMALCEVFNVKSDYFIRQGVRIDSDDGTKKYQRKYNGEKFEKIIDKALHKVEELVEKMGK